MKKLFTIILIALLAATTFVACEEENNNKIEFPTDEYGVEINSEDEIEYTKPSSDREFTDKNDTVCIMTVNGAANLRTETNFEESSKAISVKNGTELKRTGVDSKWSRIEYEGVQYYVSNSVIVEKTVMDGFVATTAKIEITTASVNVRYVPARTSDDPITSFKEGDVIEVVGFNKDLGEQGWYKVKLEVTDKQPHEFGYISAYEDYSKVVEGTINSTPATDEGTGEANTEAGTENADG